MQAQKKEKTQESVFGNFKDMFSKMNTFMKGTPENKDKNNIMTKGKAFSTLGVGIVGLLGVGYLGYTTYEAQLNLDATSNNLGYLSSHGVDMGSYADIESFRGNNKSIEDVIDTYKLIKDEYQRYETHMKKQQNHYDIFLRNLYLPSANVWKNSYTNAVDISIMGAKYLEKDLYQDIPLIQRWSDFFKNVGGNDEFNEINDVEIGTFEEDENGYFVVPVKIGFTSDTRRAFLLLVDKLSMTSNPSNIALFSEFMFYLMENIKTDKQAVVEELKSTYAKDFGKPAEELGDDLIIGYHLYNWIKNGGENKLIDNAIIDKTIKQNVSCENLQDETTCLYKFRDKYRSLPQIAYTLGAIQRDDKVQDLYTILSDLPPLLAVKNFTFDHTNKNNIVNTNEASQYKGEIEFNVYGRGITNEEVDEIAKKLGEACLGKEVSMSLENALNRVNETMLSIKDSARIDSRKSKNIEEINQKLGVMQEEFGDLGNYKKTIRLFEMYRMLKSENLCKI